MVLLIRLGSAVVSAWQHVLETVFVMTAVGTMHLGCFELLLNVVVPVNLALQSAHDSTFRFSSGDHVVHGPAAYGA